MVVWGNICQWSSWAGVRSGGSGSLRTPDREIRNSTLVLPDMVVVWSSSEPAADGWTMSSWMRCPVSSSSSVSEVSDHGIDFSNARDQFGGGMSKKNGCNGINLLQ